MADSTHLLRSNSDSASIEPESPVVMKQSLPSLDSAIIQFTGGFGWTQFLQAILVALAWIFDGQQTFISIYTDAEPTSDICHLPKSDKTIVSEWDLGCTSSFLSGLPASSFFVGCLIGGFTLATLGDTSLGRKNVLVISLLTMCLAAFLTIFSTNVWIYSSLRFISGIGRASIGTCAVVLSTEMVASHLRGKVATIGGFFFTIGFVSLPAIAYLNRDSSWRNLYVWTSIPGIVYSVFIYFFVLESPRWVIMSDREGTKNTSIYSTFKILLDRKWAVKRLFILTLLAFGIGMVYYSMPLAVGNLGFDIYWSVVFNALSEIPSLVLYFFFVAKWNRRESLVVFSALSGICSVMCALVSSKWKSVVIGLELVSFFNVCVAFGVVVVFALELFPTNVRNLATSLTRQALVLGAAFSPILISAGRKNKIFSYGVFGVVIFCCSFFVYLLPETKGISLCNTMDEQESIENQKTKNDILV